MALQQIHEAIMSGKVKSTPSQLAPQQQRGRSLSRKSNTQSAPRPAAVRPMKQAYASALATSNTQPKLIRNINTKTASLRLNKKGKLISRFSSVPKMVLPNRKND